MLFFNVHIVAPGYILIRTKYKVLLKKIGASGLGSFLMTGYTIAFLCLSCTNQKESNAEGPSPQRTPAEELTTFQLAKGLTIQLVASEPMVQDPVVITFDPEGRLWVVEMRGFMNDIDGDGDNKRIGRVSVLEDTDGDGKMDASKIYMDSLIMPRALALVPGGALIVEDQSLWLTQDLDGDFHADTKELLDSTYAGNPSPEHSGNGLWRNVDNWYYNVKSRFRYHLINGKWKRDSTEFRGQWGISNDDEGRLYYNYNWSQLHADLVPPNYLSRNKNHTPTTGIDHGLTLDRRVYPIRPNPAVNRGYIPGTLNNDGRLLEFTAACSPFYYHGTALPKEYYGNVFVCEPAGNLIKRNIVEENGLLLTAHDPTPGTEFLASTDERFRPVFFASGPDGALYVADMYTGVIQYSSYVTPYLKEQSISRKLVQPINLGRIWRIVPQDWKALEQQKFSAASSEELILMLSSPNGWHRDMAQRLLVEKGDKSISKALAELVLKGNNELGRFHALWTMEGLSLLEPDLLFQLLQDTSPLIRTTAVRLLEPMAKENNAIRVKLEEALLNSWKEAPIKLILQASLTARVLDEKASHKLLLGITERFDTSALIRDAVLSSLQDQEFTFLKKLWNSPSLQVSKPSREIFMEMLTTAVVRKGDPKEVGSLLTMLDGDETSMGWKENAVLTAISTQGKSARVKPIQLMSIPKILTAKNSKSKSSQLNIIANMFEWPGHKVDTSQVNRQNPLNETEQKQFVLGRQLYINVCGTCHGSDGAGLSRFAPPLAESDWVLGDEKRLALILLHGLEGPVEVNGKRYDAPDILPVMPAHSTMDDASISSILTYIRNAWGNTASPVSRAKVGSTRVTSQGRVMPWTATELNKHILELQASEKK